MKRHWLRPRVILGRSGAHRVLLLKTVIKALCGPLRRTHLLYSRFHSLCKGAWLVFQRFTSCLSWGSDFLKITYRTQNNNEII